jgi:hypothetical protein
MVLSLGPSIGLCSTPAWRYRPRRTETIAHASLHQIKHVLSTCPRRAGTRHGSRQLCSFAADRYAQREAIFVLLVCMSALLFVLFGAYLMKYDNPRRPRRQAQSRRRCGRREPIPGADVAGVSPVPAQTWQQG